MRCEEFTNSGGRAGSGLETDFNLIFYGFLHVFATERRLAMIFQAMGST